MKRWLALAVVIACCLGGAWMLPASGTSAPTAGPQYTADRKLIKPANYREWVYLSSGLGMNYAPTNNGTPMFTNVFVEPGAYREFMNTGEWPDKTVFVLDIYSQASHGSILKGGHYQDSLMAVEAEVKDSATPDLWTYYNFGTHGTEAAPIPKDAGCFSCHDKNAAVEHSFVQFYPTLLEVAMRKGTIKAGVSIPLNPARFMAVVTEHGWSKAEQAYYRSKQEDPASDLLNEEALSMMANHLGDMNKTEEAISLLELVTKEYPKSVRALDNLAQGYAQASYPEQAWQTTQKELQLLAADTSLDAAARNELSEAAQNRLSKLQKK